MTTRIHAFAAAAALLLTTLAAPARADEGRIRLAPGAGSELVAANCVMCHSLDYIHMNSPFLDEKGWTAEVHKMVAVFGAPIAEDDQKRIVAYLAEHYGKKN